MVLAEKGVFSKHSGNCIVVPNFSLLSKRLQNLVTCFSLNFVELYKVSEGLDNIYIRHFTFLVDYKNKKHQMGDPYIMSNIKFVQSYSNFARFIKIKNKQVAKIASL